MSKTGKNGSGPEIVKIIGKVRILILKEHIGPIFILLGPTEIDRKV